MKTNMMKYANRLALMIAALFMNVVAFAQEKGADINVDIEKDGGSGMWYANPWVWVVGAAVFILLLAAILRSGRTSD